MESFTLGSYEMVQEMVRRLSLEKYDLSLNKTDMTALIWFLAPSIGLVGWDLIEESERETAEGLFSSIAETLGVGGI